MMMSETMWRRSDDWVGTEVEDSMVMLNIESGKYVSLNRSADAIWQALEAPRTAEEVCAILQARFAVAQDACASAVAQTLETMRRLELAAPE